MNTMKVFTLLLVVLCSTSNVYSAKILGVFPTAAPSHYILGSSLMKELAQRGHDVTIISPFSEKNPPKNGTYKDVVLTGFIEAHQEMMGAINIFEMGEPSPIFILPFFNRMMVDHTEKLLKHPNVQELLNSKAHFDLVIVEQFLNEAQKAFAAHYNAPLVVLSTLGANVWVNNLVGNPAPTSYISDIFLSYGSNMTFYQRIMNSLMYLFNCALSNFYTFPRHKALVKQYFPTVPDADNVLYNISLVLLNSHPSINQPVPHVPNMIEIGGYHVKPPKKLPDDLQKFLDDAPNGVIYFSLGSNIKSALLPVDKRNSILKTFAQLKQKVLWKWEEDYLHGQPENVKLGKWLPQQDILAHPNVKLFITHGGLLSTTETVYHGVPVLAIPIGADQKLNAQRMVNDGLGLLQTFKEISVLSLTKKINELLNNPKYAETAKKKSRLFHDRIVSPMDTAVYWVEYVIRNKGASHLKVAALDLPWYKYFLLDVIAFLLVVSLTGLYIFYRITKKLFCKVRTKKNRKTKTN